MPRGFTAGYTVVVAGVGGVGGYFGWKLADRYAGSDVTTALLVRGENAIAIRLKGLKLVTPEGEGVARPAIAATSAVEIGPADLVLVCVKSYDLEETVEGLRPCVTPSTAVLPLLNGVDATERISAVLPHAEVWRGCAYIVSRLVGPGVVRSTGNIHRIYFGAGPGAPGRGTDERLERARALLADAGIDAHLSPDMDRRLWEKFAFISPFATLTSYLDKPVAEILNDEGATALMLALLKELKSVMEAAGLKPGEDLVERMFGRMKALPGETTSSMHDDFRRKGRTELDALTGFVAGLGRTLGVPTPHYDTMYRTLKERS